MTFIFGIDRLVFGLDRLVFSHSSIVYRPCHVMMLHRGWEKVLPKDCSLRYYTISFQTNPSSRTDFDHKNLKARGRRRNEFREPLSHYGLNLRKSTHETLLVHGEPPSGAARSGVERSGAKRSGAERSAVERIAEERVGRVSE